MSEPLRLILPLLGFACWASAQVTEDTPGWFPFVIPGLDTSRTHTDLSWLNPKPAGAHGHLRVQDGRFVDGRGQRVRLFGTNLTATSFVMPLAAQYVR